MTDLSDRFVQQVEGLKWLPSKPLTDEERAWADALPSLALAEIGTSSSGNRGHAGRPGHRGGSAPREEAPAEPEKPRTIDEWRANLQATLTYSDPVTGLRTEVVDSSMSALHLGRLLLRGSIYDGSANVGHFARIFDPERGVMEHDMFILEGKYQSQGFGRRFYQHCEAEYIAAGVKSVELFANLEVGGYAWARMGFDFRGGAASAFALKDKALSAYAERYGEGEDYEAFVAVWPQMHSWDLAAFVGPDGERFGKDVMLGSYWWAYKSLEPGSDSLAVGQTYYDSKKGKKESYREAPPPARRKPGRDHVDGSLEGESVDDEDDEEWARLVREGKLGKDEKEKASEYGTKSSGHWGHKGVPGERGGSAPSGGAGKESKERLGYSPEPSVVQAARLYADTNIGNVAKREGASREEVIRRCESFLRDAVTRPVSIRAPMDASWSILQGGRFQSQFESRSSGGWFDPDGRRVCESYGLGAPTDLPDEQRPIYGYLAVPGSEVEWYGEVEFVLKDSAKERATFTAGDSLDGFLGGIQVGSQNPASEPGSWDAYVSSMFNGHMNTLSYVEAQIHGGVRLADVDRVIVHLPESFVGGEFDDLVRGAGIPLEYDSVNP